MAALISKKDAHPAENDYVFQTVEEYIMICVVEIFSGEVVPC